MDGILNQIYYDPQHPAGYGGANALSRVFGIPLKQVQEWLKSQSAYTVHKPARKRYLTRPYRVSGINHLWQVDLADMQPYANQDEGYKYILTVIDVFSWRGWARPVKSKKAQDIIPKFEDIFRDSKPLQVQSDEGMEFESNAMKQFWAANEMEQYSVKSQFKASIVERFNQTLKTKMWRYFTHRRTRKWIDVLPNLLEAYNNSYHRSIRMTPNEVNENNEMLIWLYNEESPEPIPKRKKHVQIGDHVRISRVKGAFEKGYLPSWTKEIFTVSQILPTQPLQVKVRDYNNEEIKGSFYLPEIQAVDMPDEFEVEEVIRQRRVRGQLQYFVKWMGYPATMNSWINANDIRVLD